MSELAIITEPEQASPEWLSAALGCTVAEVTGFERIGTGQMSRNYRLDLEDSGPTSVVIKVPASDLVMKKTAARAYQREVYFYSRLAERMSDACAPCLHHAISANGNDFVLVLADLAPATQGDQLRGCSIDDAKRALENLAIIHAAGWNDPDLLGEEELAREDATETDLIVSVALDEFLERLGNRLAPRTVPVLEAFRGRAGRWGDRVDAPLTILHGDYRLDNLLFGADGIRAVDWQTASFGPPGRDVAYFLGNSITIEDRRRHEDELLGHYRAALAARAIDHGADELRDGYARGSWLGPLVTMVGALVATKTERGDEMFIAMADRAAAQIIDNDAIAFLD